MHLHLLLLTYVKNELTVYLPDFLKALILLMVSSIPNVFLIIGLPASSYWGKLPLKNLTAGIFTVFLADFDSFFLVTGSLLSASGSFFSASGSSLGVSTVASFFFFFL